MSSCPVLLYSFSWRSFPVIAFSRLLKKGFTVHANLVLNRFSRVHNLVELLVSPLSPPVRQSTCKERLNNSLMGSHQIWYPITLQQIIEPAPLLPSYMFNNEHTFSPGSVLNFSLQIFKEKRHTMQNLQRIGHTFISNIFYPGFYNN